MNITNLSEIELKAMIYDQLAQLETVQRNIKVLQEELVKRSQQERQNQNAEENGTSTQKGGKEKTSK